MRQLMLIGSLVGLLMYMGFVIGSDDAAVTVNATRTGSVASLQSVLEAAGAETDQVLVSGWVPTQQMNAADIVRNSLGWREALPPASETREIDNHRRGGVTYVVVRWAFSQPSDGAWADAEAKVRHALFQIGDGARITVQLEGRVANHDLTALKRLADRALDAVDATDRQPWSEGRSASVAGRSDWLPDSPFGVNVQVAIRQEASGQQARVWAAWPTLQQEY